MPKMDFRQAVVALVVLVLEEMAPMEGKVSAEMAGVAELVVMQAILRQVPLEMVGLVGKGAWLEMGRAAIARAI